MKELAAYIMRGRMQAMIIAATLALVSLVLPPVSIVSSASVALVTLRLGAYEGLYVLASSTIAYALLGLLLLGSYQFGLLYAIVFWLPVWLISIALREGRHLSLAVELAVLLGILGIMGFYLYSPDAQVVWKDMLLQMLPENVPAEDAKSAIDKLSRYMTGIAATGMVSTLLLGLFVGRWWQAMLYNPGGFRQEFLSLTAHSAFTVGSLLVLGLALISSNGTAEIAWNVVILMSVLYTFIGIAVLHTVLAATKLARYAVPMLYITLFLIPHAMLPVALIGLADPWLNLRKKHSTPTAL